MLRVVPDTRSANMLSESVPEIRNEHDKKKLNAFPERVYRITGKFSD